MLSHEAQIEIVHFGQQIGAVIEGDVRCRIEKLPFFLRRCDNRAAELANVVKLARLVRQDVLRSLVGASVSSGHPNDDDIDALEENRLHNRVVQRLDAVAQANEPFENIVDALLVDAFKREDGTAAALFHANDDIAAADVVDVVSKGTNGMDDGVRIEIRLELDARGLNRAQVDKVINVHWYGHDVALLDDSTHSIIKRRVTRRKFVE